MDPDTQPKQISGQIVSCRVLDSFFRTLPKTGLPPEALTKGIDYPLTHLRNKNKRIDWESFLTFLENAGQIWDDDEFVLISEDFINTPLLRPFNIISRHLFSLKELYHFGVRPDSGVVSQLFRVCDGNMIDMGANHIVTEYIMHPGYSTNHHFSLIGVGTQQVLPNLVGLPKATVTMERFEDRTRFDIWLPENSEGILVKLRRLITWPFTAPAAINELREAYEVLQKQNLELEAEIVARTKAEAALEQANTAAEAARQGAESANQAKSVFLANMSHELRTPLNAILGFSQLMARAQGLSSKHQEYVNIINRSGEHLLTLINDILDLTKIEAGHISQDMHDIDLFYLLDSLENMFCLKAQKKGIKLFLNRGANVPQLIRTDEVKLRQILINLLNNAIKFTEVGEVALRVAAVADNRLHFEIEDTGPGINSEEQKVLFQAFIQTSSGQFAQEGSGLGLAISHRFVGMLGGELQVSSQPGQGSCFCFDIEFEAAQSEPEQNQREPQAQSILRLAPDQPDYRILIVDDKWDNRHLLTEILAPIGFTLKEAVDGREALDLAQAWQPHLMLLDIRMPVIGGLEVALKIRQNKDIPQPVIIAISASALTQTQRAAPLAAGCDDFIAKPFQAQEILDKLSQHLDVRYRHLGVHYRAQGSGRNPQPGQTPKVASEKSKKSILKTLLPTLPADWLEEMKYAATTVDGVLASQLISRIAPEHPEAANILIDMINKFQFSQLMEIMPSTKGEH